MSIPQAEMSAILRSGETVLTCMEAGGIHASEHDIPYPTKPHVLVTNQRIAFASKRGLMKKRFEEDVSWPLTSFTERLNSSEGAALGPFMYFLSLFARNGETVSVAFKSTRERDEYKQHVMNALNGIAR
jgi:hypothetical protein